MHNLQQHPRLVAGGHEAGQAGGDHNRIADQHIVSGLPDTRGRPCDRHQPDRAVKGRHVKADYRLAIGVDFNRPLEKRDQFFGRGGRLLAHLGHRITARPDRAHGPVHSVNQTAINIAQLHPQLALAKEIALRIRGLKRGQVQDANVNSGQRQVGRLARLHPGHGDRHIQRPARLGNLRRVQRHRQRLGPRIDRGIG